MVAVGIAGDFALPILVVSLRHAAVVPTSMPEAAINKDSQALSWENEVRAARERLVAPPPAGDSGGAHNRN
jgi:hypothetical protein